MDIKDVEEKIITVLTEIYEGRWEHKIDPAQAQVLGTLLQREADRLADELRKLSAELGLLQEGYDLRKADVIHRIHKSGEYDLTSMSEKKIENLALQKDKELREMKARIKRLKIEISALKEKIKTIGYRADDWKKNIVPIIEREWRREV